MTSSARWTRATREHPCPKCGGPDNCETSRGTDGQLFVWCGRVDEGSRRQNEGGQFLHVLDGDRLPPLPRPRPHRQTPRGDYSVLAMFHAARLENDRLAWLAENLGVSAKALQAIGTGYDRTVGAYTFPERDADGKPVGFCYRFRDGSKNQNTGGSRGLTFASDWLQGDLPILLPEGASDAAALITIGLNAVGRPSNSGGIDLLAEMLIDVPASRPIIVLGERDKKSHDDLKPQVRTRHKPDCPGCQACFPGRWGAARTAKRLAELLERPIEGAFPPSEKDVRAWLKSQGKRSVALDALGREFLAGLKLTTFSPPAQITPDVSAEDEEQAAELWRETMLQSRIASLGCPGFYADTSPPGSGKSTVDIRVLEFAILGTVS